MNDRYGEGVGGGGLFKDIEEAIKKKKLMETCIRPGGSVGTFQRWIYHRTVCRTGRCCATN